MCVLHSHGLTLKQFILFWLLTNISVFGRLLIDNFSCSGQFYWHFCWCYYRWVTISAWMTESFIMKSMDWLKVLFDWKYWPIESFVFESIGSFVVYKIWKFCLLKVFKVCLNILVLLKDYSWECFLAQSEISYLYS